MVNSMNVGSMLGKKNNDILRERQSTADSEDTARGWMARAKQLQRSLDEAGSEINYLSSKLEGLSSRNERLEDLIAALNKDGVASNALGTIHVLKAEALNEQAFQESWTIKQKREANLRLAAEAEYDYRLKNDPAYRLNTCADALMKMATYSDNADAIRKTVSQMYATGKVRKDSVKDELIEHRIAEMRAFALYENESDTVPTVESVPPSKLEFHENNKEEHESFSQVNLAHNHSQSWVR